MLAKRKSDGEIIEVREWRGASDVLYSSPDMNQFYQASDLEPYTEPEEDLIPSNSGELKSQDADKQFNTTLKDEFREHNRLHIAAMIAQGIMANSNPQMVEMNVERVVDLAILTADALIAECEKGGQE